MPAHFNRVGRKEQDVNRGRPARDRVGSSRSPTALWYLRNIFGLSQQQLAHESGVSQTAISDYENGLAMPVEHAVSLLHGLQMNVRPEYMDLTLFVHMEPHDLPVPWEQVLTVLSARKEARYASSSNINGVVA